ncbi:MAG TPA: arylsulfatase [Flavisolibacter sp.]|jgi:arylsulfatase A-like enzyme|nr:arylsulfatase [Flavisolibacter sp.]
MRNVVAFLFTFFLIVVAQAQKAATKPNIIVLLADDLGYGDIGPYGQQEIQTPNLDRLAKMGTRFTQFYSGSTVCAPARSSFMTGQHTGHTPIRGNRTLKPEGQVPLPESTVTIAMKLKEAGYKTAAFGKWSMGFITTSGDPKKKGFDHFYGYNCQTLAHNYYPDHLWENHNRLELPGNTKTDSVYSADLIHAQAMNYLSQPHHAPFFLYLPYTLPHADVVVPHDSVYQRYVKTFAEQPVAPPANSREGLHFDPYPHAAFAAMVTRLDRFVGEIMQLLKEKGLEENTLLIFTSDNGPHREKGGDPDFFNSSGGLRGIKRDLYEGGIRVPFIAYQKGVTKSGLVNHTPTALWDLYPTFLQMAGIKVDQPVDGISLLPALKGEKLQQRPYFYWALHEAGGKQAVRVGDWKAVRVNVSKDADAPIELYHLKTDPQEKANIATKHPERVAALKAILQAAYVPAPDWPLLAGEAAR